MYQDEMVRVRQVTGTSICTMLQNQRLIHDMYIERGVQSFNDEQVQYLVLS